jgi:hypothetical protein
MLSNRCNEPKSRRERAFLDRRTTGLWLASAVAIAIVFLAPIARTPFISDEAFNSYFAGYLGYERLSLVQGILIDIDFFRNLGRFFPITPAIFGPLFNTIQNVVVIKLLQIFAIVSNLIAFWFVVVALGRTRKSATLATILYLLTLQFTSYFNASITFDLLLQFVALLFFLTMLCTIKYCSDGSKIMLAIVGILTIINGLTYEVSYAFAPIMTLVAIRLSGRLRSLSIGIASVGSVGFLVLVDIVLRAGVHIPSDGTYRLSPSVSAFVVALAVQMTATIPLIYLATNPFKDFTDWSFIF